MIRYVVCRSSVGEYRFSSITRAPPGNGAVGADGSASSPDGDSSGWAETNVAGGRVAQPLWVSVEARRTQVTRAVPTRPNIASTPGTPARRPSCESTDTFTECRLTPNTR